MIIQREFFAVLVQSEELIVVSLLAMDWIKVVTSIVRIVIMVNSVSYWISLFIVELYVPR